MKKKKKNGRNNINAYSFEFSLWEGFKKEATLKPLLGSSGGRFMVQ